MAVVNLQHAGDTSWLKQWHIVRRSRCPATVFTAMNALYNHYTKRRGYIITYWDFKNFDPDQYKGNPIFQSVVIDCANMMREDVCMKLGLMHYRIQSRYTPKWSRWYREEYSW